VWQVPALLAGVGLLGAGLVAVLATKPSDDLNPAIVEAEGLIADEKHVEAIKVLNEGVFPRLEQGLVTPDQARQYHLLLSRAIYLGARTKDIRRAENFQSVIDEYAEARRANATLEPRDLEYLAESNIELGRLKIALEQAERLPNQENERLVKLLRRIVTTALSPKGDAEPDLDLASELVARMLVDAQLSDVDRLWATTRQSELRIADGQYEPAIRGILQQMQRLGEGFAC
jgi:AcrR family transcriptional regulator